MSEYHPHPPVPDHSPENNSTVSPEGWEQEEQAKSARYYDEASRLYLAHLQNPDSGADRIEPMTEAWLDFESTYEGSFEDETAFVDHCMQELGWLRALQVLSTECGIPAGSLRLDYPTVYHYLSRYYRIFCTTEQVLHVFTRPGIKPMAPDLTPRGGATR